MPECRMLGKLNEINVDYLCIEIPKNTYLYYTTAIRRVFRDIWTEFTRNGTSQFRTCSVNIFIFKKFHAGFNRNFDFEICINSMRYRVIVLCD